MPWRDVADQAVCSQFRELDDIDANKAAVHDGGTTTVQPSALVKQVDAKRHHEPNILAVERR